MGNQSSLNVVIGKAPHLWICATRAERPPTVLCGGNRGRALGDRNRSSRRSLGGLRRHREVRGFVPRRLLLFAKQRGARRAKRP